MPNKLHQYTDYKLLSPPTAASSADITGSSIDMSGYDGCEFTYVLGTAGTGATATFAVQTGASTTAFVAISGATAASSGGLDNKLIVIDVCKPRKRYLRPIVTIGTTTDIITGGIIARRYGARSMPTTATTTGDLAAAKVFLVSANT